MTNIVYDYPKSSCNCYNCTDKEYLYEQTGFPTNMSVRNCKVPDMFQCYDRLIFSNDIEPSNKHGTVILNPQAMSNKFSNDFKAVKCSNPQACPEIQYASSDPRLVSPAHSGQVLTLDRPSIQAVPESPYSYDISMNKDLDNYGKNYRGYSDINAGDIIYYIDKSREDPFYKPLFTTPAHAIGTLFQDPMGAMKPQYDRVPLRYRNPLNTENDTYSGGLSWMEDSLYHREDLLARQMRNANERRYMPRWKDTGL